MDSESGYVLPSPEEWAQSQRDWEWFHENKDSLLRQYPEQWVAILNGRVIAHHATLDEFTKELRQANDPKGLAVREFVTAEEPLWIL